MTSSYSVNYQLRAHKRDSFIEFIKSLLLTPFILASSTTDQAIVNERYLEVLGCVEDLIVSHIRMVKSGTPSMSRLSQIVPSIGGFFTPLPLKSAFLEQDIKRGITGKSIIL
jgi:IMP and pyridine-specific 5'-nucleotidase